MGSGERGVEFSVLSEQKLKRALKWENVGWEGAGWGELCIEDWGELDEKEYTFVVEGESVLFGTVATANHSFVVSYSSSSSFPDQIDDSCSPLLWDTTPNLYGIETYPSNLQLLPSSLRSFPFIITTKALSPCKNIGMSKDILIPMIFNWTFLDPIPDGLVGVDPNDWVLEGGGIMNIPTFFLEDRGAFPLDKPVGIQVLCIFFFLFPNSFDFFKLTL